VPEPNRPPWRVSGDIADRSIGQLVDGGVGLVLDCESCPNIVTWTPAEIGRRLRRHADKSLGWIGPRLRCSRCNSEWVRISRAPTDVATSAAGPVIVRPQRPKA